MLLGASFQIYWWIKTGVTVSKHPFWVKIGEVFPRVTLKFDGWRWKTIGYLFCATSSFAHHFVAKQWIQIWVTVRKLSIPKKIVNFLSRVILKLHRWPWKTIGHLFYTTSSSVNLFIAIGSKLAIFLSLLTLKLDRWPWKTIGLSPMPHHALYIISLPYVKSNWSCCSETAKLGFDLCDLDLWYLTLTFWMDISSVDGNNSWTFCDDTMRGT